MAQRGVEFHLPLVPLSDLHQMIGVAEVEFREDLGSVEQGEHSIEEGQWILVLDSDLIEVSVVDAETQRAIFLLHKRRNRLLPGKMRAESTRNPGTL